MKNDKIIIFLTAIFIFLSFVFLSVVEMKQGDINSKNVWMLYFANPKSSALDFTIENHSKNTNFHFEIFSDKTKVKEGDLTIPLGAVKTIPVSAENVVDKKITITVTNDEKKKEIYKNL